MQPKNATASNVFHMIRSLKRIWTIVSSCETGGTRSDLPGMIPLLGPESSVHEGCVAAAPESKQGGKTQV